MLVRTLRGVREEEYVRFVADWLTRAVDLDDAPALTGNRTIDALAAAATAHCAMTRHSAIPAWTNEPERVLDQVWYPGPSGLFAHALVHSPLAFVNRGVLVEEHSLESV